MPAPAPHTVAGQVSRPARGAPPARPRLASAIAFLAVLAGLAAAPSAAAAQLVIQPGQDGFITKIGSQFTLPTPLPAGFFGMKGGTPSDVVPAGTVLLVGPGPNLVGIPVVTTFLVGPGCHTGSVNIHCYEQQHVTVFPIYDTVVQRGGTMLGPIGDVQSVDIALVHLSLQSVDPITVTYGGVAPSFFDVFVSLAPGPGPVGSLTLHRTSPVGGLMDTSLPVLFQFTAVGRDPLDPVAQSVCCLQDVLTSRGLPFLVSPEPNTVALLATGLAVAGAVGRRSRRRA